MARILVLDDEPLIAELLQEWLTELGHDGVCVSHSVTDALALTETTSFDAAILDLWLGRGDSLPVAECLEGRGVPFVFATGQGSRPAPGRFDRALVLNKPFAFEDLRTVLARLLDPA
jgi:DNA-binding response OmpR family regulator